MKNIGMSCIELLGPSAKVHLIRKANNPTKSFCFLRRRVILQSADDTKFQIQGCLNTHPVFEHTPQFGFWFPRTIRTKGCISVLPYFRMHNCTSVAFICFFVCQYATTKHEYIKCWLLVGLITTLKCWKNPILYLMAVSNEVPWEGCTWCRLSIAGAFPFEASFQQMVEMVVVKMIPNMLMKVLGSW